MIEFVHNRIKSHKDWEKAKEKFEEDSKNKRTPFQTMRILTNDIFLIKEALKRLQKLQSFVCKTYKCIQFVKKVGDFRIKTIKDLFTDLGILLDEVIEKYHDGQFTNCIVNDMNMTSIEIQTKSIIQQLVIESETKEIKFKEFNEYIYSALTCVYRNLVACTSDPVFSLPDIVKFKDHEFNHSEDIFNAIQQHLLRMIDRCLMEIDDQIDAEEDWEDDDWEPESSEDCNDDDLDDVSKPLWKTDHHLSMNDIGCSGDCRNCPRECDER